MAGGARFLPIGFGFLFLSSEACVVAVPAAGTGVALLSDRSSDASGCPDIVASDLLLSESGEPELPAGNCDSA